MLSPETVLQGRYRIIRQLGQGGMGAVYEAVDERLDTVVALKETLFTDEKLRKQFEREARLLARLHHQALPRVSDHFNEGDGQFLVMQYIPGEDLFEMLARRNGPFGQEEVLRWADQLCDALDYLHTQDPQIIHRDIKPQNLKLTARGQMVLLDFGLAKGYAGQMSIVTTSASVFGYTPNYAPLEQVQGLGTDSRSDIYALAATLYHLMTNVKPPDALSRAGAMVNSQNDPLRSANQVTPQVSNAVAAVLAKGMSQKRDDRYASAVAMREALRVAAEQPLGDAKTILVSESAAFADAKTAASEQSTKLAGEQTKPMASEAQTLLTDEATNVRGPAATAVTAVRSQSASRRSRMWLGAALLLVVIAGGAGGFYAYRARHRETQQNAASTSQKPAQPGESNPTASSSVDNSAETNAPTTSESKTEKAADTSSQRTSTSKQTADKSADTTKPSKDQAKNPTVPNHDVERNPDRNSNSNTGKSPENPSNDQGRNPRGRGQPRSSDQPGTRTFPNGTRVVTQPDGTRIVTMPNGTTRVFPPGEKPNRRRNRIP